jgi:hypothetical protein
LYFVSAEFRLWHHADYECQVHTNNTSGCFQEQSTHTTQMRTHRNKTHHTRNTRAHINKERDTHTHTRPIVSNLCLSLQTQTRNAKQHLCLSRLLTREPASENSHIKRHVLSVLEQQPLVDVSGFLEVPAHHFIQGKGLSSVFRSKIC